MIKDRKANSRPGLGSLFSQKGFTLLELAFVLTIIGLIIGAGAELLPMLEKQSNLKHNQQLVTNAKDAVIGYVLATGTLPFAAQNTDGVATINQVTGYLPWATLGIPGNDANMKTMLYAVATNMVWPTTTTSSTIKGRLAGLISNPLQQDLFCNPGGSGKEAFVVVSSGENRQFDAPNGISSRLFSDPYAPIIPTNDDILAVEPLANLQHDLPSTWPGP